MRTKQGKTDAVAALYWQITHISKHLPWPQCEYRFDDVRLYRFDLCWPAPLIKIAVEVDGGVFRRGGGAHTGTGHVRDMAKNNLAVLRGYRVLHFLPEHIIIGDRHNTDALDAIVAVFETLGIKT